ncbi:Uncharacterised protein [Bordetella pertussis]|nr:Uncharacterised protein [Bordetella pertussis]
MPSRTIASCVRPTVCNWMPISRIVAEQARSQVNRAASGVSWCRRLAARPKRREAVVMGRSVRLKAKCQDR